MSISDRLYTVRQVAEEHWNGTVSVDFVRDLYHQGELKGFPVGRKILILRQSVLDYEQRHSNEPKEEPAPILPPPRPPLKKGKVGRGNRRRYEPILRLPD